MLSRSAPRHEDELGSKTPCAIVSGRSRILEGIRGLETGVLVDVRQGVSATQPDSQFDGRAMRVLRRRVRLLLYCTFVNVDDLSA